MAPIFGDRGAGFQARNFTGGHTFSAPSGTAFTPEVAHGLYHEKSHWLRHKTTLPPPAMLDLSSISSKLNGDPSFSVYLNQNYNLSVVWKINKSKMLLGKQKLKIFVNYCLDEAGEFSSSAFFLYD